MSDVELTRLQDLITRGFKPVVQYRPQGVLAFWGSCEYVTADDWLGIRQAGDRLDEAPAALCTFDHT